MNIFKLIDLSLKSINQSWEISVKTPIFVITLKIFAFYEGLDTLLYHSRLGLEHFDHLDGLSDELKVLQLLAGLHDLHNHSVQHKLPLSLELIIIRSVLDLLFLLRLALLLIQERKSALSITEISIKRDLLIRTEFRTLTISLSLLSYFA